MRIPTKKLLTRDKAFEAGCDDYMAKPIMAPALREMIKKYFGE